MIMNIPGDDMDHNPMQDPGTDTRLIDHKKNGPDFSRGRSKSKQAVNITKIESIHSS